MVIPIDSEKTLEVIERMKFAKIGKYKKWELIIKKIKKGSNIKSRRIRILFKFN